jgi:UDP-N-acetylglucosamine 2-epimerase (non-hydrolysing)
MNDEKKVTGNLSMVTSEKHTDSSHELPITNNQSPVTKLKILTVVGTRPEIIRLSRVMAKLDQHFEHIIVHTGQNYDYELNQIFFDDLGIRKPDFFLESAKPGNSACQTIGNVIAKVDEVLAEVQPDALLVLGDTNSCLAAYPAKRRKIPVFHMEAGNRCFDQRVPEEINRKIVDHISDINLCYSDIAREYLLREGLPPDRVIKTGSPMFEVLKHYQPNIEASDVLDRLGLTAGKYFVVSAHREENIDDPIQFEKFITCLNTIVEHYQLPIIVSTHPRTRNRLGKVTGDPLLVTGNCEESTDYKSQITNHKSSPVTSNKLQVTNHQSPVTSHQSPITNNNLIHFMNPLGFNDYVHLQTHAKATLSDSGTITEESSILNFPALNIRNAHERPEGMEEGTVMMTGLEPDRVMQGLAILESQPRGDERLLRRVADYSMPNVSDKIVRIIVSYTDYVQRYVWHK